MASQRITLKQIWVSSHEALRPILASQGRALTDNIGHDRAVVALIYYNTGQLDEFDARWVTYPNFAEVMSESLTLESGLSRLTWPTVLHITVMADLMSTYREAVTQVGAKLLPLPWDVNLRRMTKTIYANDQGVVESEWIMKEVRDIGLRNPVFTPAKLWDDAKTVEDEPRDVAFATSFWNLWYDSVDKLVEKQKWSLRRYPNFGTVPFDPVILVAGLFQSLPQLPPSKLNCYFLIMLWHAVNTLPPVPERDEYFLLLGTLIAEHKCDERVLRLPHYDEFRVDRLGTDCKWVSPKSKKLGEGSQGQVYLSDDGKHAVKRVKVLVADKTGPGISEAMLNDIVTTYLIPVCPFFVRQYDWTCCGGYTFMLHELATTTWYDLDSQSDTVNLSLLFQSLFGLMGLTAIGVSNPDVHRNNVFLNPVAADTGYILNVTVDGVKTTLYVPTEGYRVLIGDFGFANQARLGVGTIYDPVFNDMQHLMASDHPAYPRENFSAATAKLIESVMYSGLFDLPAIESLSGVLKAYLGSDDVKLDDSLVNPGRLLVYLTRVYPQYLKLSFTKTLGTYSLTDVPYSIPVVASQNKCAS